MLLNSKEEASELVNVLSKTNIDLDITIASHMDDFISTVTKEVFQCFILDWNYTQYSAIELIHKIRKSNKYKKTPIVVVTNKEDAKLPMQYAVLDVDFVISRPFKAEIFDETFIQAIVKKPTQVIPEHYNVLILDDNPDILELIADHMLELKHTKFKTCSSIAEAKKLLAEDDFDLFLLDWNLGDGTCIDLIEFIRSKKQNKRLSEALIMVITGRDSVDDIMTLLRYDVKDYIIKPFDYSELEEKLLYAFERRGKINKAV